MNAARLPSGDQARSRTTMPKSTEVPFIRTWSVPLLMVSPFFAVPLTTGVVAVGRGAGAPVAPGVPAALGLPAGLGEPAAASGSHPVSSAAAPAVSTVVRAMAAAVRRRARAGMSTSPQGR